MEVSWAFCTLNSVLGARQEGDFEGSVMREKVMSCVLDQNSGIAHLCLGGIRETR